MSHEEVLLSRDVVATLIPHGEEFTLGRGEKVTITHRLGGNFTVMTLQGMYRIAASDADALGEQAEAIKPQNSPNSSNPAGIEEIKARQLKELTIKLRMHVLKIEQISTNLFLI